MRNDNARKRHTPEDDCCCLQEAALEAFPIPVAVHDDEAILYANAALRGLLGIGNDRRSIPLSEVLSPDFALAAAERRRLVFERNASIRDAPAKLLGPSDNVVSTTSDAEPVCLAGGVRAIVQCVRRANGTEYFGYRAPIMPPDEVCDELFACVHAAAFERLPLPATVRDRQQVICANRQTHLVFGAKGRTELPMDEVLHPDYFEAGTVLHDLTLNGIRCGTAVQAKLRDDAGRTVRALIGVLPIAFRGEPHVAALAYNLDRD
jgi:hypothetical protein